MSRSLLAFPEPVRDARLYKSEFGTFENYCRSRWRMSRSYAHRLMESASVVGNLLPIGNTPETESQTREIASFSHNAELQQAVWQVAQATAQANVAWLPSRQIFHTDRLRRVAGRETKERPAAFS